MGAVARLQVEPRDSRARSVAERFDDPEGLVLDRAENRYLSFGHGAHFCLGAPLARLEGQLAIAALARRFPGLALAGEPKRRPGFVLRGFESLPLLF